MWNVSTKPIILFYSRIFGYATIIAQCRHTPKPNLRSKMFYARTKLPHPQFLNKRHHHCTMYCYHWFRFACGQILCIFTAHNVAHCGWQKWRCFCARKSRDTFGNPTAAPCYVLMPPMYPDPKNQPKLWLTKKLVPKLPPKFDRNHIRLTTMWNVFWNCRCCLKDIFDYATITCTILRKPPEHSLQCKMLATFKMLI